MTATDLESRRLATANARRSAVTAACVMPS